MTLDEQQAICDTATGPSWEAREVGHEKRTFRVEIVAPQYTYGRRTHSRDICQIVDYCEWTDHPANACFIATARTEWPALIAEHRKALALLKDLADDLESEVNARYRDDQGNVHPAMQCRYERDMQNVVEARKMLEGK